VKRNLFIIGAISVAAFFVYYHAFFNFFAQDDFILITQFSGHGLFMDLIRAFGPPQVTHWRPFYNLYFLISGYLFGKDIFWYHFLTFTVQVAAGFFIFKILRAIGFLGKAAFIAALLYVINPSHFNTYFWISGGATAIGFLLFIISFFLHLVGKKNISLVFFLISLLASEAMIVGLLVISAYDFKFTEKAKSIKLVLPLFVVSVLFLIVKFFLTPKSTFDAYKIEFSPAAFGAVKFYTLRTLGFAGVNGDQLVNTLLLVWIFILAFWFIKETNKNSDLKLPAFFLLVIVVGMFPFLLIPSHLSANYMNISIFGFSAIVGIILDKANLRFASLMTVAFIFISFFSVRLIEKDSWVVKRSNLAYFYLGQVEKSNPPAGSTLVFNDNYISSSYEAYISLGTGKAISFFFPGKNYITCFSAFENCGNLN